MPSRPASAARSASRLTAITGAGLLMASLASGVCAASASGANGSAGGASGGSLSVAGGAAGSSSRAVTLVTGDRVQVTDETGGRRSIGLERGAGREKVSFHQLEVDGELHVLPSDALPLVAEGSLDGDLFNIDLLLADGFDDSATTVLPLIATTSGSMGAFGTLEAAEQGPTLESIDGRSIEVTKEGATDFWTSLTRPGTARMAAGVQKLWLDGRVRADLDRSVAQIGTHTAWEAGFDGAGIKVAVLDTGVDVAHPDLVGRVSESRNFSNSTSLGDRLGTAPTSPRPSAAAAPGRVGTARASPRARRSCPAKSSTTAASASSPTSSRPWSGLSRWTPTSST